MLTVSPEIPPEVVELFDAVEKNDENAVRLQLEEKKVPATSLNGMDQTIAHVAAEKGNLKLLKYALEVDPSMLAALDFHGESVIFLAIESGCFDMVKYLVDVRGVSISQRHERWFSNTAIHKAAEAGRLAILKYFLEEKKGDVNVENILLQTPVVLAAESKHHDVIKYLAEERNADLSRIDYRKCNILYTGINTNDLKLIEYVLDERKIDLDINWTDEDDLTLVHRAAILNRFDIMQYLVGKKHADVNIADKWGKTPLQSAARWNYYDLCRYLVENGANVNAKDQEGKSPIQEASEKRLIDYFLEKGSQKRSRRSVSPLSGLTLTYPSLPKQLTVLRAGSPSWSPLAYIQGEHSLPTLDHMDCVHIQSFLIVAERIVKRLKATSSRASKLTLEELNSPTNVNVTNAIRVLPRFDLIAEK